MVRLKASHREVGFALALHLHHSLLPHLRRNLGSKQAHILPPIPSSSSIAFDAS